MPVTATQIREMASHSTVEVVLTDVRDPRAGERQRIVDWPQVVLPSGEDGLVLVEAGDIAEAAVRRARPRAILIAYENFGNLDSHKCARHTGDGRVRGACP